MGQIVNDRNLFEPASVGSSTSPFSTEFVLYEDFTNSAALPLADTNTLGALNCTIAGTGSIIPFGGENDHPGIYAANLAAANDDAAVTTLAGFGVGPVPLTASAVVRVTALSGNTVFCGLGWNGAQPGSLTRRAQIVAQNGGADWLCESSDGVSLATTVVTGFSLNAWSRLTITLTDTATVFAIDGTQVAQHASIGTSAPVIPVLGAFSPALGSTATIQMDLLTVAQSGLNR